MTPYSEEIINQQMVHLIFIIDCSGSMTSDGKIDLVNSALQGALPAMRDTAKKFHDFEIITRVITFGEEANWHVSQPTPLQNLAWDDVAAVEMTPSNMGEALGMVSERLEREHDDSTNSWYLTILISDGEPTDNWEQGIQALANKLFGKSIIRLAIGIGWDIELYALQQFIEKGESFQKEPFIASDDQSVSDFICSKFETILKKLDIF